MKRLRNYSVQIALGVLAVLGIWLWLDSKRPVHEPGENPKVSDLIGIAPADVTRLEISNDGKTTVLTKAGAIWTIEKPIKAAADSELVKRLVDAILDRTSDYVRDNPDSKELAAALIGCS